MITVQQVAVGSLRDVIAEIVKIGASAETIESAAARGVFRCLRIWNVSARTAHLLKEGMLTGGGEAVVSAGAYEGEPRNDLLLFGALDAYRRMLSCVPDRETGELREAGEKIKRTLMNVEGSAPPKPCALKDRSIKWGDRTLVMGILNATPDSFYPGSRKPNAQSAIDAARKMISEGADIIDIGGESTRPGAQQVSAEEERGRVIPVIQGVKKEFPKSIISIDTSKASIAAAAIEAGADIINDITALSADKDMPRVAAESGAPVCLMHIQGTPRDMQSAPRYERDVVGEIIAHLSLRIELAVEAGVKETNIIIDPGIGFGKTAWHNLEILRRVEELRTLGRPILIGASRKSFIGKILDVPEDDRLEGSIAVAALAAASGADILRVHDVRQTLHAVRVADAVSGKKHLRAE